MKAETCHTKAWASGQCGQLYEKEQDLDPIREAPRTEKAVCDTASCNSGGAKRHWSPLRREQNTEAPTGNQSAIFIGEEGAHTYTYSSESSASFPGST